ncbi:MAG: GldG family protein [Nitrospirae bacterium]|nr:GldG family protein [Nitrospirota bacterium]
MLLRLKKLILPLAAGLLIAAAVAMIMTDEFGTVPTALAIAGLVSLLVALFAYFDLVKNVLSAKGTRYAGGAGFFLLIVLGVMVAINYIGVKRSWRVDLTETKLYSLTDKTVKLVGGLKRDIKVTAFFQEGTPERKKAEDLLTEYEHAAQGRFTVEFVDPYKRPASAKEYGVTVLGTIVLQSQGNQTKMEETNEESLTNAVVKVTSDSTPVIYFTKGHGEKDPDDAEENGYSQVKKALEDENYQVRPLALAQQEKVPADAAVVIVSGPRLKYFDEEQKRLGQYAQAGGRLLMMLDPDSGGWKDWLKDWGVELRDEVIIDPLAKLLGADYTIPLVSQYGDHEITKNFKYATLFPTSRPVKPQATPPSGVSIVKLAETTPQSWAETNMSKPKLDAGDEKGPLPVILVVTKAVEGGASVTEKKEGAEAHAAEEENKRETRLVVVGDSDFGSNAYVNLSANLNLMLNMVNWLARREALISIRDKTPGFRSVSLTSVQMRNVALLTMLLIPGALFLTGAYVFWRRRHQ